ncbi:MAG: class I SAM-dependent methyltransferase [Mycobacteriales bacterium]
MSRSTDARARSMRVATDVARRLPPVARVIDERNHYAAEIQRLKSELAEAETQLRAASSTDDVAPLYPPGHFYSPLPDLAEIERDHGRVFADRESFPGIDLRTDAQLRLAAEIADATRDQPFQDRPSDGPRYYFGNDYFGYGDAVVLHGLLRMWRPARLIEVGSGFSSALILDTDDRYLGGSVQMTFIDPYPDRLQSLLRPEERADVVQKRVQDVDPKVFGTLGPGDMLFIDSSHVAKVGSDVLFLLLDVLPELPAGVHVHIHDIGWPFEYSPAWVFEGRAWNETYLLHALLVNNEHLRIIWFADYLSIHHRDQVAELLPIWGRNTGTSMWLDTA